MGGSSLSGPHELINSLSFENLAKGIDSNSGTDIIVNSSTSFNNGSYNVALYTSSAGNTDFHASGILSFRTENLEMREQIRPLNQNEDQIYHSLNYYWNEREKQSENTLGHTVSKDWIESLNTHSQEGQQPVTRYANGSIHVHGLMQIKPENRQTEKGRVDGLPLSVGATFDGETSPSSEYPEYAIVQEPNQTKPNEQNNPIIIQEANGVAENAEGNIIELKPFTVLCQLSHQIKERLSLKICVISQKRSKSLKHSQVLNFLIIPLFFSTFKRRIYARSHLSFGNI